MSGRTSALKSAQRFFWLSKSPQGTCITPVIVRGRSDVRDRIKTAITLVPFCIRAAEAAGIALGQIRGEKERAKLSIISG